MPATASPVRRGCGSRKQGACYVETGIYIGGAPVDAFLIDPPITDVPPDWLKPHRNPLLFEQGGVWHLVIWVGAAYYPSMWDYIEEVRVAGSSRRVSGTFDFSKLSPQSRQYFVHARADVQATLETSADRWIVPQCPVVDGAQAHDVAIHVSDPDPDGENHCLGLAKYIREDVPPGYALEPMSPNNDQFRVLPCGHKYAVYKQPDGVLLPAGPAVFMQLPVTGVTMVNRADGTFPSAVEQRVRQAKVDAQRVDK